ncbi:MAG: iron-sulfur cluster assembly protein [Candidatus Marsarchaeota archaeon]|jgi:metal-sulfur cluster biosynthetic enzyme|nr:iron-sulfur cluster assembly protein [Candidatus Marsarchaeota archaeon]MCL5431038.1 iron-sulfur cluster assembly protein [Candidatus Marsarchaeota archaeon]
MVSKEQIVEALRECKDPELDANIVDIGLLYGISIDSSNNIKLTLTMTSPMCPVTSIILADVQLRLEKLDGVGKVEMDLVWDPLWSPDMMSDELKYRVA